MVLNKPVASILEETLNVVGDYARTLIAEAAARKEAPVVLSEEQKDFIAVIAAKLSEILAAKSQSREGSLDTENVQQAVMLLHGQGGSGKTEVVLILRKLLRRFAMGEQAVAATNSAARIIGGETVHSSLVLPGTSTLKMKD